MNLLEEKEGGTLDWIGTGDNIQIHLAQPESM